MFYELASPTWGQEERDAILRVLDGMQLTISDNVRRFEKQFAAYHGKKYAVMVNSGSSANLLAIACLFHKKENPLERSDEVIVPAISWATTYHPLQQFGLKLHFVDVALDSLNMDISQLESAITPHSRAIIAVSVLGNPAMLEDISEFARHHNLYFLEDNCESLGASTPGGRLTGTFGDINTFSFFFSHHISTMEGGMLVTDDEELYHLALSMRAHGWVRDIPEDSPVYEHRADDFSEAYRFILPGYNLRPLELSGAVGCEQLKKLPGFIAQRRKNLALFEDLFAADDRLSIQKQNGESSSFCFPIVIASADIEERENVFSELRAADIGFRIVTGGCFPRHDAIRYFDYSCVNDLPNANMIHDFGFFLGNHPFDLSRQITTAYGVIDSALSRSGKKS